MANIDRKSYFFDLVRQLKHSFGLFVFLAGGIILALMIFEIDYRGVLDLGLGYNRRPGLWLSVINVALIVWAIFRRYSPWYSIFIIIFFILPMALELFTLGTTNWPPKLSGSSPIIVDIDFLPFGRNTWSYLGILLVLIGNVFVYETNVSKKLKWFTLLIGAYIQSVFFYNLFNEYQLMTFFRGGWTS